MTVPRFLNKFFIIRCLLFFIYVTLVIKKIDPEKVRLFKAEAVRRGFLLNQALEEAITLWLNASHSVVGTEF